MRREEESPINTEQWIVSHQTQLCILYTARITLPSFIRFRPHKNIDSISNYTGSVVLFPPPVLAINCKHSPPHFTTNTACYALGIGIISAGSLATTNQTHCKSAFNADDHPHRLIRANKLTPSSEDEGFADNRHNHLLFELLSFPLISASHFHPVTTYLQSGGRWSWCRTSRRLPLNCAYPCNDQPATSYRPGSSSSGRTDCGRTAVPLSRDSPWQRPNWWLEMVRSVHQASSRCYRSNWSWGHI